jgi:hypothetical protein
VNRPKKTLKGDFATGERGCLDRVHSDQMVLGAIRQEAGPQERRPKALNAKLAQVGPSDSSPLRSDGSRDGQAGGWTCERWPKTLTGELENNSRKPRDLLSLKTGIVTASKRVNLLFFRVN